MRRRPAMALPAVLFAMTLTSALVVGGVYAARTLGTRARLTTSATELQSPVEAVLIELVANWDTAGRAAMPIGTVVERQTLVGGVPVIARVLRLNQHTYWLVAEATSQTSHGIQSRLGLLVRSAEGGIGPVPGPAWTRLP
jgi:hypothetical protein